MKARVKPPKVSSWLANSFEAVLREKEKIISPTMMQNLIVYTWRRSSNLNTESTME